MEKNNYRDLDFIANGIMLEFEDKAALEEGKLSAKEEFNFLQFQTYYIEKDLDKVRTEAERTQMLKDYPIVEEYPIYVLDASDGEKSQNMIQPVRIVISGRC